MIKALAVSGDQEVLNNVTRTMEAYCPNVSLMGTADSIQSGVSVVNAVQPDLLIIDTRLRDGSGFELLKHFDSISFKLIFLSNHIEYALKAFKFSAVDFLIKPPDPEELAQAVNKACDLIGIEERLHFNVLAENIRNLNKKEKLILKTIEHIHVVNLEEIIRIEADGNYSTFFMADGRKIMVSRSIKEFEDHLMDKGFYRIHKSHLINISLVKYFDKAEGGYVVMNDGASIPVASRKRELLLNLFDGLA